jgi:hypothetical protein
MDDTASIAARLNAQLAAKRSSAPESVPTAPSFRSTTSSRKPGRAIQGTVRVKLVGLVWCSAGCGHRRYASTSPHAPRWKDGVLVDCRGKQVWP